MCIDRSATEFSISLAGSATAIEYTKVAYRIYPSHSRTHLPECLCICFQKETWWVGVECLSNILRPRTLLQYVVFEFRDVCWIIFRMRVLAGAPCGRTHIAITISMTHPNSTPFSNLRMRQMPSIPAFDIPATCAVAACLCEIEYSYSQSPIIKLRSAPSPSVASSDYQVIILIWWQNSYLVESCNTFTFQSKFIKPLMW